MTLDMQVIRPFDRKGLLLHAVKTLHGTTIADLKKIEIMVFSGTFFMLARSDGFMVHHPC